MRKLLAVLAVVVLTGFGCATSPQNAQQTVFAAKSNYAVALTVAVAYKRLPTCGSAGASAICSKPATIAMLQKVDTASFALLDAAEHTVRAEGAGANVETAIKAATEAVAAFTTITRVLTIK